MSRTVDSAAWMATGVLELPALITVDEVRILREAFDELRASGVPTSKQVLYTHEPPRAARPSFATLMEQWLNPHLRDDAASSAAVAERLGRRLAARFGEELFLFQDVLMSKGADHQPFPWHQDQPYWPVATPGGVVVWCALDPVDPSNGALELAVASKRLGLGPAVDLHTGESQLGMTQALPDLSEFERRCVTLAPGDAVLFHPRTWHRSGPNVTGASRRVWSSSWLPGAALWRRESAPLHPLSARIEDGRRVAETLERRRSR